MHIAPDNNGLVQFRPERIGLATIALDNVELMQMLNQHTLFDVPNVGLQSRLFTVLGIDQAQRRFIFKFHRQQHGTNKTAGCSVDRRCLHRTLLVLKPRITGLYLLYVMIALKLQSTGNKVTNAGTRMRVFVRDGTGRKIDLVQSDNSVLQGGYERLTQQPLAFNNWLAANWLAVNWLAVNWRAVNGVARYDEPKGSSTIATVINQCIGTAQKYAFTCLKLITVNAKRARLHKERAMAGCFGGCCTCCLQV